MPDSSNNWTFITAAYAITWVVVLGYFVRVHSALRNARAEHARAMANPTGRAS